MSPWFRYCHLSVIFVSATLAYGALKDPAGHHVDPVQPGEHFGNGHLWINPRHLRVRMCTTCREVHHA